MFWSKNSSMCPLLRFLLVPKCACFAWNKEEAEEEEEKRMKEEESVAPVVTKWNPRSLVSCVEGFFLHLLSLSFHPFFWFRLFSHQTCLLPVQSQFKLHTRTPNPKCVLYVKSKPIVATDPSERCNSLAKQITKQQTLPAADTCFAISMLSLSFSSSLSNCKRTSSKFLAVESLVRYSLFFAERRTK